MNPSDPKGPSAPVNVPPAIQRQKDPFKKWVRFLAVLIVLLIGALGAYFFQDQIFLGQQTTPDTTVSNNGFISSTVIKGSICTRTICSNNGDSHCIVLSGTTQENGTCKLDERQPDKNSQGLYDILIKNSDQPSVTEK